MTEFDASADIEPTYYDVDGTVVFDPYVSASMVTIGTDIPSNAVSMTTRSL